MSGSDELGAAERAWRAHLPAIIEQFAARWSLALEPRFRIGGSASWVAPARTRTGERVVLKLGWTHEEALHEADGLRLWDGKATVRLIDSCVDGPTSALLLEMCDPGIALSRAMAEKDRDLVIAGLLQRLWIEPPIGHPFRPLALMCDQWATSFELDNAKAIARGEEQIDPGLARAGIELFRQLPLTADRSVLLLTDLHHDNVLSARREPWLVIDPKPYLGDPAYDTLQHMLNFPGRLAADPRGLADRMAGLLGLDPGRVRLWLFARCVQESVEEPDLREVAAKLAP
ncbi:MAG TPA: aminoglycoside phosphotransferase family protein [Streptosporangiaceae bacterium]|nr:aminoglycoside phosphotransferase family protein [Streptosporangiaceae bacterium]